MIQFQSPVAQPLTFVEGKRPASQLKSLFDFLSLKEPQETKALAVRVVQLQQTQIKDLLALSRNQNLAQASGLQEQPIQLIQLKIGDIKQWVFSTLKVLEGQTLPVRLDPIRQAIELLPQPMSSQLSTSKSIANILVETLRLLNQLNPIENPTRATTQPEAKPSAAASLPSTISTQNGLATLLNGLQKMATDNTTPKALQTEIKTALQKVPEFQQLLNSSALKHQLQTSASPTSTTYNNNWRTPETPLPSQLQTIAKLLSTVFIGSSIVNSEQLVTAKPLPTSGQDFIAKLLLNITGIDPYSSAKNQLQVQSSFRDPSAIY